MTDRISLTVHQNVFHLTVSHDLPLCRGGFGYGGSCHLRVTSLGQQRSIGGTRDHGRPQVKAWTREAP
jgi:hypothetical protein